MSQLDDILNKCLSHDGSTRNEGEAQIDQCATANFGDLLEKCSVFLADESKQVAPRQLCATLIKNLINFIPKHSGKWDQLPLDMKGTIKNHTISSLASNSKDIRKAAGLTVAGIFIIFT
jgi:hypothetical protein